ncbi:MAG TPA: VOC family protein [Acidimicrobiia bacterium]|nr:VOC family protein [Acidimicrobiia bacterium]
MPQAAEPVRFDHLTLLVTDLDEATRFLGVLGFRVTRSVVISGPEMDAYMGISGLEADHVTLSVPGAEPHEEVQLLRFHHPHAVRDAGSGHLDRVGFNHICFRVSDLDATAAAFADAGFHARNTPMVFADRKLVFLDGPGHAVVELAQWL